MSNTFIPGSLLQPKSRPSFTYYYLEGALWASRRGDCTRSQVGALIVNDFHVVMPGYNGTPEHGQPGCLEGACPRGRMSFEEVPAYAPYTDCIAVHAEENALKKAKHVMMDLAGAVAYVTREPCNSCHKLLADAGLAGAYWCQDEMWEPGGSPGHISYYEPEDLKKIYQN